MKICKKCGRLCDETDNFCNICGGETAEAKECKVCGAVNLLDSAFCIKCASSLSEEKICACGAVNEYDANFCNICGKNFNEPFVEEMPPVETGSWLKVIGSFLGAFVILFLICLVI